MLDIPIQDERLHCFAPYAVSDSGQAKRFERFPKEIAQHLQGNIGPLANTRSSSGCFIEFLCDSPWIIVELTRLRHHQYTPGGMDCAIQLADGRWHYTHSEDLRCVDGDVQVRFATGLERGKALNHVRINLPLISTCAVKNIRLTRGSQIEAVTPHSARWLAIGDSLTQGFSVQSPSQHWTQQISDRMNLRHWNLGLGGLGIDHDVFDWALQAQPWELVTIGLGSNQAWSRSATEATSDAAHQLIDRLDAASIERAVWLLPPWKPLCDGLGPSEYMGVPLDQAAAERLERVRADLITVCEARGIAYIDELLPRNHRLFVDGLHPAALGMQHYTQQVYDFLNA